MVTDAVIVVINDIGAVTVVPVVVAADAAVFAIVAMDAA